MTRGATPLARTALVLFACSIPLDKVPLTETASASFAIGILLVLGGMWQVLSTGTVRRPGLLLGALTAFVAWSVASLLWASDREEGTIGAQTAVQLLVFVWVAWQIALDRRDVLAMAAGYVVGCVGAAVGVWSAFAGGSALGEWEPRYSAPGFDPNELGITLAIGIPMAVHLARSGERARRFLWLAYVPVAFMAIGLSGSRSAALAGALAVLGTLALAGWRKPWALVASAALVTGAAVVAWNVVPPETWERIFTLHESATQGTFGERLPIWRAGIDALAAHPVRGVGVGGFGGAVLPALGFRTVAHNALLSVAVELGTIGALLFVSAVACVVGAAVRSARRDRTFVLTVLVTWAIGASSLTWELRKVTWFVLLLGAAVNAASERDEADL